MAITAFQRRVSLPWTRTRRESRASLSEVRALSTAESAPNEAKPLIQTSPLLALPQEIHERIYDFIFTEWSMVVLNVKDDPPLIDDGTMNLRRVGKRLLSGPPGCELLLVSRDMYHSAGFRYGSRCTSKLYIGRAIGHSGRKLINYLNPQSKFARWYPNIRSLYIACALGEGRIGMNFRTLFPNLTYAECTIHEGGYGPLLRMDDTIDGFLIGRHDAEMIEWTRATANHFLSVGGRSMVTVHRSAKPWDDEHATIVIHVLGTHATKPNTVFGFTYRWEGDRVKIASRVVKDDKRLKFWEEGMDRGRFKFMETDQMDEDCPKRFRWVHAANCFMIITPGISPQPIADPIEYSAHREYINRVLRKKYATGVAIGVQGTGQPTRGTEQSVTALGAGPRSEF